MTRKDYEVIARVFALAVLEADLREYDILKATAELMSRELLVASRFTPNGNKSFKPDVFLKACGGDDVTEFQGAVVNIQLAVITLMLALLIVAVGRR